MISQIPFELVKTVSRANAVMFLFLLSKLISQKGKTQVALKGKNTLNYFLQYLHNYIKHMISIQANKINIMSKNVFIWSNFLVFVSLHLKLT